MLTENIEQSNVQVAYLHLYSISKSKILKYPFSADDTFGFRGYSESTRLKTGRYHHFDFIEIQIL